MSLKFYEIAEGIKDAEETIRAYQQQVSIMADLLSGHLRHVYPWKLAFLKSQLTKFNSRTGEWKE